MSPNNPDPSADRQSAPVPIDIDRSVNDTILMAPATLTVFAHYGFDTCCRGAMTIRDAASEEKVDVEQLVIDLQAVLPASTR